MSELHLPTGINYECTSCGRCCSGWAVPMTESDHKRIAAVDWSQEHDDYVGRKLFRPLSKSEKANTPYTHKIASQTGACPFLVDNLCFIHSKRGMEFKPTICQLFPYCFSETPSGVYATISFVSAGAVFNAGRALCDQREMLEKKWTEFKSLYPNYKPDWSKIKLSTDKPISWEEYLDLESQMLTVLARREQPLRDRLISMSRLLIEKAGQTIGGGNAAEGLNALDEQLLTFFHKLYFPMKDSKVRGGDFHPVAWLWHSQFAKKSIRVPLRTFSLTELAAMSWPDSSVEINDIIERYVYSYIFGKKYFGAGFAQVTVIGGFHHLILMIVLLKLHTKAIARAREANGVELLDLATAVRDLERQVGETKLGGYGAALWEALLYSPKRVERLLANF